MSSLSWHWHRLQAMDATEVRERFAKKVRSFFDQHRQRDWGAIPLERTGPFPILPKREDSPAQLRSGLEKDAAAILKGQWFAFAHLPIRVDDPPQWHHDYLADKDLRTERPAFQLNHRELPGGGDIKLIWELSRWFQLVRLAQAGWLLGNEAAVLKCVRWLDDWTAQNRPFFGWNWTSPLESGMRLIQFTWMDALVEGMVDQLGLAAEWERLRYDILPSHAWFTWRYKSFGSSANNHLLGELSGLIVAAARWRNLEKWTTSLTELGGLWEREVLSQFAEDGGNREQALNYHLFSFEFSWQARNALASVGMPASPAVEERLSRAAEFFLDVQQPGDPWDYGDSDNGFVSPFFTAESKHVQEWFHWFEGVEQNTVRFWLGAPPGSAPRKHQSEQSLEAMSGWRVYPRSGIGIQRVGKWMLRWDLSELGYLSTAAHGHLDALHLSIWLGGVAMIVDPGTGAYYADEKLRRHLSSWAAHNGPRIVGLDWPRRLGPFLWSDHHPPPTWQAAGEHQLTGHLQLLDKALSRSITRLESRDGWMVEDQFKGSDGVLAVRWQFPPGSILKQQSENTFQVECRGQSIWLQIEPAACVAQANSADDTMAGICSPSFRKIERGPFLELRSSHKPCVLRTTFLSSPPS